MLKEITDTCVRKEHLRVFEDSSKATILKKKCNLNITSSQFSVKNMKITFDPKFKENYILK